MNIEVRLFATLRNGRWKKNDMECKANTTTSMIIDNLNINESEVAILLINGRDGELTTELKDGDIVSIFPPVGGG